MTSKLQDWKDERISQLEDQIEHMSVAIENSGSMAFAYKQEQEIERLRGDADQLHIVVKEQAQEVQRLRKYTDGVRCPACDTTRLELGEARAEIERLQNANQDLVDERDIFKRTLDKRDAEIERLHGLLSEAHLALSFMSDPTRKLLDLRYRLREALGE